MIATTEVKKTYIEIPTWDSGNWNTTPFLTRNDFRDFIISMFKEPGKYEFDETSFLFNSEARKFRKEGFFSDSTSGTLDYKNYWDDQKLKCRRGVIFKTKKNTWYIEGDYYMWLNFLPINDKEQKKFDFAQLRDAQYHTALYELSAELHDEDAAICKKRQIAMSYFHCAKLIRRLWFEETPILKLGASDKKFVNENGDWKFLDEYRNFLNEHTAWYRPMNPGKVGIWQQQVEVTINNRKTKRGLKGVLQALTFDKDPEAGIGGPTTFFFYDEGGNAPTADVTYRYLKPSMKSGMIKTGFFVIAGSVGELDKAEPLKKFVLNPTDNGFHAVKTNLLDDKGTTGESALFIPEQWSMPPFIDEFGNSKVEEALEVLNKEFEELKRKLTPEEYQLEVSQRPRNLAEAFAFRKESKFPLHLISAQKKRIEDKTYPYQFVDLSRNTEGKVVYKTSHKLPISEWPVSKKTVNKEGVCVMYEPPITNNDFLTYFGSIDPVGEGKTVTSESLCSLLIYKNDVELTQIKNGEQKVFIEPGKIVFSWCGRYDDINKTHELLEMILELYNAWTAVENNISLFIQHMIHKKKQKYLAKKSDMLFLKELGANESVFQEYGWKNTGVLFSKHLLNYGIEFLKEVIHEEVKDNGDIIRKVYGIERIPDIMILKEMEGYGDGVNTDRLVTFCALIAFVKVQQANRGLKKRLEEINTRGYKEKEDPYKINKSPFNHIGSKNTTSTQKPPRNPFKNLR